MSSPSSTANALLSDDAPVADIAEQFGYPNLASFSRWTAESTTLPSPSRYAAGFIGELARLLEKGSYPVLFPTTERTIQLVAAARDRARRRRRESS